LAPVDPVVPSVPVVPVIVTVSARKGVASRPTSAARAIAAMLRREGRRQCIETPTDLIRQSQEPDRPERLSPRTARTHARNNNSAPVVPDRTIGSGTLRTRSHTPFTRGVKRLSREIQNARTPFHGRPARVPCRLMIGQADRHHFDVNLGGDGGLRKGATKTRKGAHRGQRETSRRKGSLFHNDSPTVQRSTGLRAAPTSSSLRTG
jgi:hypothetical protein